MSTSDSTPPIRMSTDMHLSEIVQKESEGPHWLIDSKIFETAVTVLIVANAIEIGLSVDHQHYPWNKVWSVTGLFFAGAFSVELFVKIVVLGRKFFKDRWNVFDMFLVVTALLDIWVLYAQIDSGDVGTLTALRIIRLMKILRVLRLLKRFKELILLCDAMANSVKTLFWVFLLMTIFIYIYSIFCAELIGRDKSYSDYSEDLDAIETLTTAGFNNYQYFGTVGRSFMTLLSLLTLSEWSMVSRPLAEHRPEALFVVTVFTFLTAFGVMNVVVGVLVEQALEAAKEFGRKERERESALRMTMIEEFQVLMNEIDTDGSGQLSEEEFLNALNESVLLKKLIRKLDLPSSFTVREMFVLMDSSGDGKISTEEFKGEMVQLMDCNPFQSLCILLMNINHLKSIVLDGRRAYEGSSDHSMPQRSGEGEAFPCCTKKDIANLQAELQEMKVEICAKVSGFLGAPHYPLNTEARPSLALSAARKNLTVMPSTDDGILPSLEANAKWIPLPAPRQSPGVSCSPQIVLGQIPTETEINKVQLHEHKTFLPGPVPVPNQAT